MGGHFGRILGGERVSDDSEINLHLYTEAFKRYGSLGMCLRHTGWVGV